MKVEMMTRTAGIYYNKSGAVLDRRLKRCAQPREPESRREDKALL